MFLNFVFNIFVFLITILIFSIIISTSLLYSLGKKPFGSIPFISDVLVFLFFGLISTNGSFFVYSKSFNLYVLMQSFCIGFFCASVINLNNIRDIEHDKINKKETFVVKIGLKKSIYYHTFLVLIPFLINFIFYIYNYSNFLDFIFLILLIPIYYHLKNIILNKKNTEIINKELKKMPFITFLYSVILGVSKLKFLFLWK